MSNDDGIHVPVPVQSMIASFSCARIECRHRGQCTEYNGPCESDRPVEPYHVAEPGPILHMAPGSVAYCDGIATTDDVVEPVGVLTPLEREPESLPDWNKPSRAVCVSDGDDGAICFHVGAHIADMIESVGTRRLGDLGLDNAPPGISIFEGKYQGGGWVGGDYDDPYLVGDFRDPTDEEWAAIRVGSCPWNFEDWFLEPGQCCHRDHNRDGNCDIHEAPGRRRPWPAGRL